MADTSDLWYRLGYALENARHGRPARSLRSLSSRPPAAARRKDNDAAARAAKPGEDGEGALELALTAGAGAIVARLLDAWPGRDGPGVVGLARGAAAGALAAVQREALAPLLQGELETPHWDEGVAERAGAGAARGLVYGALLEPRLVGPGLLRGLTYGAAEWALGEWGGVRGVLARHTPYRRLPVVGSALGEAEGGESTLVDNLAYGIALGLLYDAGRRMGMGDDGE